MSSGELHSAKVRLGGGNVLSSRCVDENKAPDHQLPRVLGDGRERGGHEGFSRWLWFQCGGGAGTEPEGVNGEWCASVVELRRDHIGFVEAEAGLAAADGEAIGGGGA